MSFYDASAKNAMLDQLGTVAVRLALHTADPGAGADNEVSGGDPAYARQTVAYNPASGGEMTLNGNVEFDVPGSTAVNFITGWNAAGSTRYFKRQVTEETFGGQGIYRVRQADSVLDLNNDPA